MKEESHRELASWLEVAIRDWGTGLERRLYEEVVIHFLGGADRVLGQTAVMLNGRQIQSQPVLWAGQNSVVRVTALDHKFLAGHEEQLHRFVDHTQVAALQWINVGASQLTFKTTCSGRCR